MSAHENSDAGAPPLAAERPDWPDRLFAALKRAEVRQVAYVPDAGHARLIERCKADAAIRDIVLTSEEEGIALSAGAWLGGERAVVLMQSSGVGNCVNMLSLARTCRFPLVLLITMRGEWEEFNPWQMPMGSIVEPVLRLCEAEILRVVAAGEIAATAERALQRAFGEERIVAVLLSQQLIGRKVWTK
jgi:sulfopyruvate decarboxylase alpha subunit